MDGDVQRLENSVPVVLVWVSAEMRKPGVNGVTVMSRSHEDRRVHVCLHLLPSAESKSRRQRWPPGVFTSENKVCCWTKREHSPFHNSDSSLGKCSSIVSRTIKHFEWFKMWYYPNLHWPFYTRLGAQLLVRFTLDSCPVHRPHNHTRKIYASFPVSSVDQTSSFPGWFKMVLTIQLGVSIERCTIKAHTGCRPMT